MSGTSKKATSLSLLGEKLVQAGLISHSQLQLALQLQKLDGRRLGEILHSLGFLEEDSIARVIADDVGVEFVRLDEIPADRRALALIPEAVAREYRVLPLRLESRHLVVAMEDPLDIGAIDRLRRLAGRPLKVVCATASDIRTHLNQYYAGEKGLGGSESVEEKGEIIHFALDDEGSAAGLASPIVRWIDKTIQEALQEDATDIHFEPGEDLIRVRYRIDGVLHHRHSMDKKFMSPLMTRLKVMAELNITESRKPQSGRAEFSIGNKTIDIRVSTFPTIYGENMVLRLLDKDRLVLGLENLGYNETNLELFKQAISSPSGIILVTGPTGCGKTTTLYSALTHLAASEKKIITLEDPVEYELPMIRQSQINPKAGLTFASGLRAILRQDPDIILIGEMRDPETVETAIRASLTGHLVLSTLHTNDAVGAITRLLDMEVEPYLISSAVTLIVAQRLVRLICTSCKRPAKVDPKLRARVGAQLQNAQFFEGEGDKNCNYTGYRGRTAICELILMNDKIRRLVNQGADGPTLKEAALESGMNTMWMDGVEKALQGKTTLEEVLRVTSE